MVVKINRSTLSLGLLGAVALSLSSPIPSLAQGTTTPNLEDFVIILQEAEDNRNGRDGVGRPGTGLCLLSPSQGQTIWHQQPLFVWQGFSTIGVSVEGDRQTPLWKTTADAAITDVYRAIYTGTALEPGESYQWLFFISPEKPAMWSQFEIMAPAEHAEIAADLDSLQADLEAQAADGEAIAIARATYFAEKDLVADALQEIFAVEQPSADLMAVQANLVAQYCSDR